MATMIRRGLIPFVARNGFGGMRRLLDVKEVYDALEADLAGYARHFHVHMMAVEPALQGRGLGSRLLSDVLSQRVRAGGSDSHLPTILTTHTSQNVVFYRRLGFEVTMEREVVLAPGEAGHPVWGMRQPARAPE